LVEKYPDNKNLVRMMGILNPGFSLKTE
jgi:hypothetical protein